MDDGADLVARLLTLAGTIMEDAAPVAIINRGASLETRIAEVLMSADQANVLARAADVVRRRMRVDERDG